MTSAHVPVKRITKMSAMQVFKKSEAYKLQVGYISELCEAVMGKKISCCGEVSPILSEVSTAFQQMSTWLDEIPPQKQSMRYGNTAFKVWHARMAEFTPGLMQRLVEGRLSAEKAAIATVELTTYFSGSFGDPSRIDYGTGHELSMLAWFTCLHQLELITAADREAVVLVVFQRYLLLMRQLQSTYLLEPAGSHGVWGLDDYQFLPFIFGAAQLVGNPEIEPISILDEHLLEAEHEDYFYLSAVRFIREVKKGPFAEHSPMLNDITQLEDWSRVLRGLLRMYEGEVLGKFPVVQHLAFGSLLPWDPAA